MCCKPCVLLLRCQRLHSFTDPDDPDALMLGDGQQRLVPGDDEFGLGRERRADDHIVIGIERYARPSRWPHHQSELRIALDELMKFVAKGHGTRGSALAAFTSRLAVN